MEFSGTNDFMIRSATGQQRELAIDLGPLRLHGDLTVPKTVSGLVMFAHGSGSSRKSPRNQYVAYELNRAGFATFLFDLLSLEEEQEDQYTREHRFDIPLLSRRLVEVTDWLEAQLRQGQPDLQSLPVGYFGASTGAAAALIAAAIRPDDIKAVVSRGGRPDMAESYLHRVQAPTLMLVGGLDDVVIDLNRQAYTQLPPDLPKELVVVEGASHLFEEPGKLEQVAQYAAQWFERFLRP